ncbi:hypothetical protein BJ322DRAFT_1073300 [Thelephora terrestris]|uniref:Uncharacterized protein n=1 Tax=Thelephora terrestris TaxID=56493 RepID=A0A9P6HB33_9AGAM|nr:hypothetical protein BJ322DRAFT_1073300 [Thelephora terrestris]
MPTSELSDALNPNVVRPRNYDDVLVYQDRQAHSNFHHLNLPYAQPPQQPQYEYVPHRSELELAVVEPALSQSQPPAPVDHTWEVIRILANLREFEQAEQTRRSTWEREQRDIQARIQGEYERRFRTMQEEIDNLKERIRRFESATAAVPATSQNTVSEPPRELTPFQDLSQEHLSLSNQDSSFPLFVQGSSMESTSYQGNGVSDSISTTDGVQTPCSRKRTTSPSSDEDESSECDEFPSASRPTKRINGHDTRCLTVQHAMRLHLNRLMSTGEDDPLPANHIEGAPLADNEPVRFVWGRTIRQSQHNARMKIRVIGDLMENKGLYKHVPNDDFTMDNLDIVFDQTFSTLRSRYKAQNDANVAQKRKKKDINKMIKIRRANRKRAKLEFRTACRAKNETYSQPTFDGAFQLECMSSEESEDGTASGDQPQTRLTGRAPKSSVIHVRGLGWRSSRLVQLFHILDEVGQNDPALSSTLPRGDKGKHKMTGAAKDTNRAGAFVFPPKGVSSWMISRGWLGRANLVHRDLGNLLTGLIVDHPEFDFRLVTALLGHDNETEESRYHMQQYNTSSSLQYALARP